MLGSGQRPKAWFLPSIGNNNHLDIINMLILCILFLHYIIVHNYSDLTHLLGSTSQLKIAGIELKNSFRFGSCWCPWRWLIWSPYSVLQLLLCPHLCLWPVSAPGYSSMLSLGLALHLYSIKGLSLKLFIFVLNILTGKWPALLE